MSGHSKWKKIKRQKGAADLKKGNIFTRLGQAITLAVRDGGGGDPDMNFMLRIAIDKAREANMPNSTVQRAIDKGLGKSDEGPVENITYDIAGKGGVAILVDCLTDNKNRTISEIRKICQTHGFSIGSGSLSWLFEEWGRIIIEPYKKEEQKVKGRIKEIYKKLKKEDVILQLMEIDGVEDVSEEETKVVLLTLKDNFKKVYKKVEELKLKVWKAEVVKLAKNKVEVGDNKLKIEEFISELEGNPDVLNVWSNIANTR